ncbi:MAG: hypothetical protein JKY65_15350 [Planctomycetes bacterium]|nr:hypothetical protein [Planctomycetota bacterium]
MLRPRQSAKVRCPWCLSGEAGRWVTCKRDNTKIHAECLEEYGTCPICRRPVEDTAAVATDESFQIEPLPAGLSNTFRAIGSDYGWFCRAGSIMGYLGLSALLVLGIFSQSEPTAAVAGPLCLVVWVILQFVPRRPAANLLPNHRADAALATRIAAGDRSAREARSLHRKARAQARSVRRALEALAPLRQQAYRVYMERTTPIEDAERIRGIDSSTTGHLRNAGIRTLTDLLRRPYLEDIAGVSEDDARRLLDWSDDRVVAIGRLATSGDFPDRELVDREGLEPQLAPLRELGERAVREAAKARQTVLSWADQRASLRDQLRAS